MCIAVLFGFGVTVSVGVNDDGNNVVLSYANHRFVHVIWANTRSPFN